MNGNKKDKKYFLVFCILSIVLIVILFGINSIMRGTNASFGGITGELTLTYKVTYYANWPVDNMEDNHISYDGKKIYQVLDNMYDVPSGYEFLGWGIEPNGSVIYNAGHVMSLSDNLNLYAIWGLVDNNDDDNEDEVIVYGDADLNGIVNENDYLLIDSYILDNSLLIGQGLINADVNIDGKVDNIDSDIIKQVCLGTDGYVGFLPDKPILIYDLYVKDDNDGSIDGDKENDDSSSNTGGSSSSGNNGGGSSSGGTGSTGSGGGNSGNSGGSNPKPNSGSNNSKPSSSSGSTSSSVDEEPELPKVYEFKFMNGTMEYAKTECDVLQDGTCKLVLPNTVPSKVGYVFDGWSLNVECNSKIIKDAMTVKSGATYYACYFKVFTPEEKEDNTFNILMIIFGVWILSSILIYRLVKQFKNKEIN